MAVDDAIDALNRLDPNYEYVYGDLSGNQNKNQGQYRKKIDESAKKDRGATTQSGNKKNDAIADASGTKPQSEDIDDVSPIWCPSSLHNSTTNNLWIKLQARGIESMASWGRSDKPLTPRNKRFTFFLLAPNELQEIVSHDWGPYESLAATIAEKAAWAARVSKEIDNIGLQAGENKTMQDVANAWKGGNYYSMLKTIYQAIVDQNQKGWGELVHRMATAASQADVAKTRIDTALVYKNSERRKYDFVFYLADVGTDLYKEIIYPVKLLEYLSSPTKTKTQGVNDLSEIDFPFYFTIETYPIDFLKIEYAALTLVQPTWRAPYVDGQPSMCELHLSFTEIPPLWDSAFYTKGLVTTGTKDAKTIKRSLSGEIARKFREI